MVPVEFVVSLDQLSGDEQRKVKALMGDPIISEHVDVGSMAYT